MKSFCSFVLILGVVRFVHGGDEWGHELTLERGVTVKWNRDDPVWLTMEMSAPTTGYVALGFSPNGGMGGSDIVLGWVDSKGQGVILDMYATANTSPKLDAVQNYELLSAQETGGRTTIRFRRKWDTCDNEQDFVIEEDTVNLIWAYNKDDPVSNVAAYHGEIRGVRRSYIRIPATHAVFPAEDDHVKHWDIQMHNNTVTGENDAFYCTIVKFPALDKKHHLIGFQPLLDDETKWNIHHMIMYECIVPESEGGSKKVFDEHATSSGGKCYTPVMPPEWSKFCVSAPIMWTSGSEGNIFPEKMGFPLGEEHGGSTYFMFEIHYDNPQRKTFTDSSGLRLIYTDKLREFDGSVFAVGHKVSPFATVPPSMPDFVAKAYCTSECTAQILPPEGITVITVLLHAHYTGSKLELKHLRNGKELPPLAKDSRYNYNYQQARVLQPGRQVLPGDELVSICEYDRSNKNFLSFGGIGTRDEMCLSFVYYYPRIPLAECKSQPEFESYMCAMGIHKVEGAILEEMNLPYVPKDGQEKDYPDNPFILKNSTADNPLNAFDAMMIVESDQPVVGSGTVGEFMRSIDWATKGKEIERKWLEGKHYAFCTGGNQKRFPLKNYVVSMPKYEPLPPKASTCV